MQRALQSVALALVLALLASSAAAMVRCASMQQAAHCPQPVTHDADCSDAEDGVFSIGPQPMPMDGPCCHMAPARPAPRTDLQGPAFAPGVIALRTVVAVAPAFPAPPPPQREAVFLHTAESPQAVLCTFLI